jgi:hypothetical protein
MAGKRRVRFRGAKHTSKRLEADILERSKNLADDPSLLRPMCAGNCRKCAFDKTFKTIDGYQKFKNSPDALIKEASRGGDDIAKAYAGTISLNAAGTVPMLATAKLGGETVSYAIRGSVGNDKQIGCQYYTDPKIRLLLYNQFIKKNKLHLYSFEHGLVCSDKPNMPEDYLYEAFWETPYEFKDDEIQCGHDAAAVLVIHVKSLDKDIRICKDCAGNVSTLQFLVSQLSAVDPLDDFEVRVEHKYHNENGNGVHKIEKDALKDYMQGKTSDSALIASVTKGCMGELKSGGVATYIIGVKNYGSGRDAFLGDLMGTDNEKTALELFLTAHPSESLIIKTPRAAEALSAFWTSDWREIISLFTSDAIAASMGDMSRTAPSQALEDAHKKHVLSDVTTALPEFKKAGKVTTCADRLAKAGKVGGAELVKKEVDGINPKDSKSRIICKAFVVATDPQGTTAWKMTAEEEDYARYLVEFAKAVIAAPPEKYRDAMSTLLTASGCGETV